MSGWLSSKVHDNFGHNKLYNDTQRFGVEVEFEGVGINNNVMLATQNGAWKVVPDGSLRGESFEAVMKSPKGLAETIIDVKQLYETTLANGAIIKDSMRAGVHVHLNCQNITIRRLITLMTAYYCVEDLLVEQLGEERSGNLFCLRLSDAEDLSFAISNALAKESLGAVGHFHNDNLRYAAMNLASLGKFGTLEFRALRTPTTPEPIIEWLKTLDYLYLGSKKFDSPLELIAAMSANGEKEVLSKLFLPSMVDKLLAHPKFEEVLYRSIRNIQSWVYRTNWSSK